MHGVAWPTTPKCNRPQLALVWSVIEPRIKRISQSDQRFVHVFALSTLLIGETFAVSVIRKHILLVKFLHDTSVLDGME